MAIVSTKADRADWLESSLDNLARWFPEGTTVHTVYMKRNDSGTAHTVKVIGSTPAGELFNASYAVAVSLGYSYDTARGGVRLHGGGMDTAARLVINMARRLHGNDRALWHRAI